MYSSATWLHPEDSLDQASVQKMDRICRKLELRKGESLVEIGTAQAHRGVGIETHHREIEMQRAAIQLRLGGDSDRQRLVGIRLRYRDRPFPIAGLAYIERTAGEACAQPGVVDIEIWMIGTHHDLGAILAQHRI